jgi:hypothetical protein
MRTRKSLCIGILILLLSFSCQEKQKDYAEKTEPDPVALKKASIERGEYLVSVIGCDHCHTPKKMTEQGPVPDLDRWMMGYPANDPLPEIPEDAIGPGKWVLLNNDLTAAVGPWGVSFGGNLTPDDTGIGSWSFAQFKKAMTEGKYKGMDNSRPLMPPMPWQSFAKLSNEDLKAIYDYLMSIKPIENVVPSYRPPAAAM